MTIEQLSTITGKPVDFLKSFHQHLLDTFEQYAINTPLRKCHFLAQVLHESGCFRYLEEIASGEAYEGRSDLGNTEPGDGKKFKGRGLIQITGRANYSSISVDFGIDFISNPEYLEQPRNAVFSAGWYWNKRKLNKLADGDNILAITKRVNGGVNGIDSRIMWLNKCKNELI